ncbi:SpvB/TcaC N-terminal domain-containing protein [Nitrospira lenta]|uniref:RHS repeat-associated core domain-containing protein n=1 Tax=Nitrospira lenta TaxID=1436998 RepID=A0A330L733_9BACT|nr:SpvB/TcaC N-terminal domain-containing protein [Nitrospira lenta]SPP65518.1 RHS repeat-associated core domain-containing protein [Nitrospira lenta]
MTPSSSGRSTESASSQYPGARTSGSSGTPSENSFQTTAPSVSLPKGGGAIRGIGEKFAANPVTGTGSMSVPIAMSPGRSGFGPQLSLSYDSGAGNTPFGLGWNLSLPAITRKTDKGVPRYHDGDKSDVFILSGAEDLVPVLNEDGSRYEDTTSAQGYRIRRYRPRIEGLFARIERWTNAQGVSHWRSISKDNVTTLYGSTDKSCVADPAAAPHIFSWLICESYDDTGNAIVYEYAGENDDHVDRGRANERNRARTANRYLKRIKYGNHVSRLAQPDLTQASWMFEVVFDYGDHDPDVPLPDELAAPWPIRQDPFSTYRAGFEVRTYRLCRRVLMFHHFSELGAAPCLVRSTDLHHAPGPIASLLTSVTQSSYRRKSDGTYRKKSLPPVEFTYSEVVIGDEVHEVDAASVENLPQGLDHSRYQWVDLDGEGLSGILTEQSGAWFYKRNQSAVPVKNAAGHATTVARFAPLERVATMPSPANLSGDQQFMDLAGNGRLDVVDFEGPVPGFFARTSNEEWAPHRPFTSIPNIAWQDPNLKLIDLTGDGHADILITEDHAFTWYQSMAEAGFASAETVRQAIDEEQGPRLVFADGTQSIYQADMSGDGLTDLVRIRNGDVCYWPNLGYGRFGAKVAMDRAPWFDAPDLFDQRRIRLADIDGSGLVDILYLTGQGVQLYFNQSGNAWSERRLITTFPRIDNLSAVSTVDLLGNGTACLVWSSPLPGDARSTLRYIDLMGGLKPHLLIKTVNNLGGETDIVYAPSTKFYLQDKQAGRPWITKLPFPVHCVETVTVRDKWRGTAFSSTYSYHHGYFDGIEREFRGFGRVEQVDIERFGKFAEGNSASPYITDDQTLYQPPIKTVTWYHTGAAVDRERILSALKHEYVAIPGFTEHQLPEPTLTPADLSAEEWREALRACKGMVLRQEVFELDVDELVQGVELPVRLYTTAYHNCAITRLQPQGINRHAVFLVTESEAITYHYELDLRQAALSPDPRIAHTLNLRFDAYGRAQQSVAVVYPRLVPFGDSANLLTQDQQDLIRRVQRERHIAYTETHFTAELPEDLHRHRLPAPCEVLTYELTGADSAGGFSPSAGLYFSLDDVRAFALSDLLPGQGPKPVVSLAYHERPTDDRAHKRLVEWTRTLYWKDDLTGPEPFGAYAWLGLPYETYKLALTRALLNAVFGAKLTSDVVTRLNTPTLSGYVSGTALSSMLTEQWWMRSGIAGFKSDAAYHFYLPEKFIDSFGNTTTLDYDPLDLYVRSSSDALGNSVSIARFDYRVLAPAEMIDLNGNRTEVYFDVLGMVVASAVKGNGDGTEGDDLAGFDDDLANPSAAEVQAFCTDGALNEPRARAWLNRATARFVYHFGESRDANGHVTGWATRPAGACGIVREIHATAPGGGNSPLQVALECSDGSGNVLMKKAQAEPAPGQTALRWIINGLTVLNNKGKPVKQYEPAFSDHFGCEMPGPNGVTPIMYYDAAGRVVRTEMPDGTFSRVEFSPWHVTSFDANDTVLESRWYGDRSPFPYDQPLPRNPITGESTATPDQRAAWLAAQHANTPSQVHLDSLGRDVIAIAHNRAGGVDEAFLTFTRLDAEGKPLWIRDARGHLVMQYIAPAKANNDASNALPADAVPCYDIAGNLLFQHSMDAGDRWLLMDAAGKPMLAWDLNETPHGSAATRENRVYRTDYDSLHRPVAQWLTINASAPIMIERYEYQDAAPNDLNNLNGQLIRRYDSSGLVETVRRDFKGNVQETRRTLVNDATASIIDWQGTPAGTLEPESYVQLTEHDAVNRMTRQENWHRLGGAGAVYQPVYNERGILESETLALRGATTNAIKAIRYNVKGQKEYLELGNGTLTQYDYDETTFRLKQIRTTRPADASSFPQRHSNLQDAGIVQQLHYTYDPVGNITEIYDEAYKPVFFANVMVEPRSRYEYDALYRLISATGRESVANADAPGQFDRDDAADFPVQDGNALRNYTQRYHYDSVSNIRQMRHVVTGAIGGWTRDYAYAFEDANQAVSNRLWQTWTGGDRTQAVTYGYDTHGNMLNVANVALGQQMQWDHRDMIARLALGGGGTAHYQYDSGKQRSRKRIVAQSGGGYWERIYLGGYERYRRYSGSGTTPVEEIESHHLFEGEQRVLLVDDVRATNKTHADGRNYKTGPLYRYQYSNHLGSACLELDHEAAIISYEEYHPYGTSAYRAMTRDSEAPAKRYRYTGMERDEESGLSYHTARYYMPWLGRWGSVDPIGISGGPNVFQFCSSSPIIRVDISGTQDRPNEHHTLCLSACHPDPTEQDRVLVQKIDAELPKQPVKTSENQQVLSAVIDDFEANDLPKWVEEEHSEIRVRWDDRIDDPEHVRRVQMVVNMVLLKTALKLGDGDHSTQDMLEVAGDYIQSMRRQQVSYVPKLSNASTSVLLRDAHYYLWGRSGPGLFGDWGRESVSQAGLGMFQPLHQWKKEGEYRGGWDSGVAGPSSSNGGFAWFRLGIAHEVLLRSREIEQKSPPRLLHAVPKMTPDEREKNWQSIKTAMKGWSIFRKPDGQLK